MFPLDCPLPHPLQFPLGVCPVEIHWNRLVVPGSGGGGGVKRGLSEPLSLWLWVLVVLGALASGLPGVLKD